MKCEVINNNDGKFLMELECDSLVMTNKFYRFIRTMMLMQWSACSYEYDDITALINGKEFFRMVTHQDGSRIITNQYINDECVRHMVIAE